MSTISATGKISPPVRTNSTGETQTRRFVSQPTTRLLQGNFKQLASKCTRRYADFLRPCPNGRGYLVPARWTRRATPVPIGTATGAGGERSSGSRIVDAAMRCRSRLQRAFQAENQRAAGYRVVHNHQCPGSESFENHGDASAFRSIPIRVRPPSWLRRGPSAIKTFSVLAAFHRDSEKPARHRSTTDWVRPDTSGLSGWPSYLAITNPPTGQCPQTRINSADFAAPTSPHRAG